jgi:hypothetical protein
MQFELVPHERSYYPPVLFLKLPRDIGPIPQVEGVVSRPRAGVPH